MLSRKPKTIDEYDSEEEFWFAHYLMEMANAGFVKSWTDNCLRYELLDKVEIPWTKQLKTKTKKQSFSLMQGMTYTPDFEIEFTSRADGLFIAGDYQNPKKFPFIVIGGRKAYVDVKGEFSRSYDAMRRFYVGQKLMYAIKGIYVHPVKVPKIFADTFTPDRYLYTPRTNEVSQKQIKFEVRTIQDYARNNKQDVPRRQNRRAGTPDSQQQHVVNGDTERIF